MNITLTGIVKAASLGSEVDQDFIEKTAAIFGDVHAKNFFKSAMGLPLEKVASAPDLTKIASVVVSAKEGNLVARDYLLKFASIEGIGIEGLMKIASAANLIGSPNVNVMQAISDILKNKPAKKVINKNTDEYIPSVYNTDSVYGNLDPNLDQYIPTKTNVQPVYGNLDPNVILDQYIPTKHNVGPVSNVEEKGFKILDNIKKQDPIIGQPLVKGENIKNIENASNAYDWNGLNLPVEEKGFKLVDMPKKEEKGFKLVDMPKKEEKGFKLVDMPKKEDSVLGKPLVDVAPAIKGDIGGERSNTEDAEERARMDKLRALGLVGGGVAGGIGLSHLLGAIGQ